MQNYELFAKFPQPGQLLRQLQRQGKLPAELQAAVAARQQGGAPAPAKKTDGATTQPGAMPADAAAKNDAAKSDADAAKLADQQEYRAAIRDYMLQNGLQPP